MFMYCDAGSNVTPSEKRKPTERQVMDLNTNVPVFAWVYALCSVPNAQTRIVHKPT